MSTGPQALLLPAPGELAPQMKLGRFLLCVQSVARNLPPDNLRVNSTWPPLHKAQTGSDCTGLVEGAPVGWSLFWLGRATRTSLAKVVRFANFAFEIT